MNYTIKYRPSAAKAIRKLDRPVARRLLERIEALAEDPMPAGCVQLRGDGGEFRVRVGDYWAIYEVHSEEIVVLVLRVGHRREIYR